MYAFRVEPLGIRHSKKGPQDIAADFRSARPPRDAEPIAAARNFYIEAAFYLAQVFVKLTAQVCQAVIVGGLEDNVPRNLQSVQDTSEISAKFGLWEVHRLVT